MKFSIITVAYNNVQHIRATIESVLGQTHKDLEYIVVDGASNDGTVEIVNGFADRIDTFISEPDDGVYHAMNKGVEAATGDVVGFVNADDMLATNDVIESLNSEFEQCGADAIYGDAYMVDPREIGKVKRLWRGGEYDKENFKKGWMPPHLGTYIKRKCYLEYGAFRNDLDVSADYELMLRFMFKHGIDVSYFQKVIVRFRLGGVSNRSLRHVWRANQQVKKAWHLNGMAAPPLIALRKPLGKISQFFKR